MVVWACFFKKISLICVIKISLLYILSCTHKKRREMRVKRVQYIVIATWIDEGLIGIVQCLHKIASLHHIRYHTVTLNFDPKKR